MFLLVSWVIGIGPSSSDANAQWFRRRFQQPTYRRPPAPPNPAPAGVGQPQQPAMPRQNGQAKGSEVSGESEGKQIHDSKATASREARTPGSVSQSIWASSAGASGPLAMDHAAANQLASIRMPGEFEHQRAIMLSISDWMPHHFAILSQIAEKTKGHVELVIFYNDLRQLQGVIEHFIAQRVDGGHIWFCPHELDTIWLRDFAPRIGDSDQGPISLDFFYEGSRPRDDAFPRRWAEQCQTSLRTVRWTVQGGNLMFNGQGIGVASNRIFQDNAITFPGASRPTDPYGEARRMVEAEFKRACNLDQLIIMEPLQEEVTRHVDMFLTFLAPDHVLVGRLDRSVDPVNAAILDRNAETLARVQTAGGPMRVSRVDFPSRNGKQWSSLTNIIMANNLVLLPQFDSDPPELIERARRTYEQLIPGCVVKTVDLTSMKALQGSLHCLSMHLPQFAPLPPVRYRYEAFRRQLDQTDKTASAP
ncbi:MAG: agmatine deiminase family protein [Planctomycetales bacterium]|nr:agmatine deiminase family protein [Planctomycetales bacterium]